MLLLIMMMMVVMMILTDFQTCSIFCDLCIYCPILSCFHLFCYFATHFQWMHIILIFCHACIEEITKIENRNWNLKPLVDIWITWLMCIAFYHELCFATVQVECEIMQLIGIYFCLCSYGIDKKRELYQLIELSSHNSMQGAFHLTTTSTRPRARIRL